jgi:molybdate transport system substrate-binding protein
MIRRNQAALGALLAAAALLAAGCEREPKKEAAPAKGPAGSAAPLLVHVGGTMRPAMEEICRLYEAETGAKVELNFNDSGALLTVIQTTGKGDVCVVHDPFPAAMEKKGLVDRRYALATLTPVIVVRKGNPKGVKDIKDFTRDDVKVGLTDAVYSTAGHIMTVVFRKAGIEDAMSKKEIVRARGGGEIANAVKIGTVDAAVVWNAVAFERKDALDAIPIDPGILPLPGVDAVTTATYGVLEMATTRVDLMTLKGSRQIEAARKLAELASSERGRAIFSQKGFSPAPSTASAEPGLAEKLSGSLLVYCAAGVKDAVAEVARLFEAETGVKVELTYANSGQLLGQIETSRKGDVFVPGDVGFAATARQRGLTAGNPREFCYFIPVIYAPKGNPKGIREVNDLARPGLRLALADESSAIGKLQADLFKKNGTDVEAVRKNTVFAPATVTEVALAVKLGTADAGLIWDALASMYPDEAEAVRIPLEKNVVSKVAACALAGSGNPRAAAAFVEHLASEKGRAVLRSKHFTVDPPGP